MKKEKMYLSVYKNDNNNMIPIKRLEFDSYSKAVEEGTKHKNKIVEILDGDGEIQYLKENNGSLTIERLA